MSNKPNVIIIMTDQQRADMRKSEGFALDTMPFLDHIAGEGADFSKAYTSMPACVPARVSMLTGRYPNATHVRTNHNAKDAFYAKDLLDVMKENGYKTALCGKNHSHKKREDFDYWYELSHEGGYGMKNEDTDEEKAFDEYLHDLKHLTDPNPTPHRLECQGPYRAVSKSIEWIDELGEDDPFFLWLSFAEPHNPYQVPQPYHSLFPPDTLPPNLTDKAALEDKSFKYRWLREMWEQSIPNFEEGIPRTRANYCGMLRLIDDQIKRIVEYLEESGLKDDTIIVFLSDHGDFAGEYGLIRKGPELPEVLSRIPMIFMGPDIKGQGKLANLHVSITDIMPSICEAIGAEIPRGVQGHSLWPIITGIKKDDENLDCAYMEHGFGGRYYDYDDDLDPEEEGAINPYCTFDCLNSWTQAGTMRAVRKGKMKLIYDMDGNGQLYNLEKDPLETDNLFDKQGYEKDRADMMECLLTQIIRAQDTLPYPGRYILKERT